MVSVALVCIAKNEAPYIQEFISYYTKLGFNNIFIYDNSDNNELKIFNKDIVNVIHFAGTAKQVPAYNHFLVHYKNFYDYVAFFDCDEFLVLKKHKTIQDFCKEYIPFGGLGINWYLFGNNGNQKYENKPVLERFTKRRSTMDKHVKTIAKCCDLLEMHIHNPMKILNGFRNIKGDILTGPFNENWDDSIAQLNHYVVKSTEEYAWKIARGRATTHKKRNYNDLIHYLEANDFEDKSALEFYLSH